MESRRVEQLPRELAKSKLPFIFYILRIQQVIYTYIYYDIWHLIVNILMGSEGYDGSVLSINLNSKPNKRSCFCFVLLVI